jgi:DNA polymerase III delta subunit
MIYLFLGHDNLSKDRQLKLIRQQSLTKETEQFNLDILYAKELNLKNFQERLLCLPVKSQKRIVVVKDAQHLKAEIQEFILKFAKSPAKYIILIFDFSDFDKKDSFLNQLARFSKVFRFKEVFKPDTFMLGRQIALKKADNALRLLNQLLQDGEKPERILGGLRYVWERDAMSPLEARRRLRLLLNCDIEIKTGRLKPVFALEKLVINLCGLSKSLG